MTTVSVIIPAHNQGHYLGEAVQSVLAQSYPDFEVVIVDDGSTDNTGEVAAGLDDPRVRYVYQENRGLSGARNSGIRCSQGPLLTFLDSDDLFLADKLRLLVAALNDRPETGLVAGQAVPIDEQGRPVGKRFTTGLPEDPSLLLLGNPLHVGSVLLRREWQERAGFFDESLRSYEDWDMWLRLARAGCPMGWVARPVSLYRFHRGQMTRDGRQMTAATFAVLDKLFRQVDLPETWLARRDKAYSSAHLRASAQAYLARDFQLAQANLLQAVEIDPSLLAGEARPLAEQLAAWKDLPKVGDPYLFLENVYQHLPPSLTALHGRRRQDLSRAAMEQAYAAHQGGDLARARWTVRRAIRYQPGWLANRGALAILLHSHLPLPGRRAAGHKTAAG